MARPKPSSTPAVSALRGAPTRQLNIRLLDPLHQRYRSLLHAAAADGDEITMTELIHALLHEGPATPQDAREVIRRWRQALL